MHLSSGYLATAVFASFTRRLRKKKPRCRALHWRQSNGRTAAAAGWSIPTRPGDGNAAHHRSRKGGQRRAPTRKRNRMCLGQKLVSWLVDARISWNGTRSQTAGSWPKLPEKFGISLPRRHSTEEEQSRSKSCSHVPSANSLAAAGGAAAVLALVAAAVGRHEHAALGAGGRAVEYGTRARILGTQIVIDRRDGRRSRSGRLQSRN